MEDRKEEVKSYLKDHVNPIVEPMLQRIAEEKPWDVLVWISTWVNQRIGYKIYLLRLKENIILNGLLK